MTVATSTWLPDIPAVDHRPDPRMWRENGSVTTVSLPWSDHRNGRTVGWCGPAKGGGWLVEILTGRNKGSYPAASRDAAVLRLDRLTEGLVLR